MKKDPYRFSDDIPLALGRIREQIDALPVIIKDLLAETLREGAAQFPGEVLHKIENATEILIMCASKGPANPRIRSMIALYPEETKVPLDVGLLNPTKTAVTVSKLSPSELNELVVCVKIGLGSAGGYIERNIKPSRELVVAIDEVCLKVALEGDSDTTIVASARTRLRTTLKQLVPTSWRRLIKRKNKE